MIWFIKQLWYLPRRLFWFGMWLVGLATLIWYLLRWGPGDQLIAVRLLNYFMPWLLLILLPLMVLTGLARRYRLLAVLLIPTIGIGLIVGPMYLPKTATIQADAPTPTVIKVMSYNVLHSNQDKAGIRRILQQERPDVVMLQEVTPSMIPYIEAHLREIFPDTGGYLAYEPAFAQATISRYPLQFEATVYHYGRAQQLNLLIPRQPPIAIWNVHPHTAVGQTNWQKQRQHLQALGEAVAAHNGPLIIGGDFNTTPQSDNYQFIAQHLANTHANAGYGVEFTFPADGAYIRNPLIDYQWKLLTNSWHLRKLLKALDIPRQPLFLEHRHITLTSVPVVRIDHIFYSNHFRLLDSRTLSDSGGSDHLPIVAVFSFADGVD